MHSDLYLKKGLIVSVALHGLLIIIALLFRLDILPGSNSSDMQIWEFDLAEEPVIPKGYYDDEQRVTKEEQSFNNADIEEDFSAQTLKNMADDLSIDDLIKSRSRFDKSDLFDKRAEKLPEIKRIEIKEAQQATEVKSKYLEKFADSVDSKNRDNSPFKLEGDVLMRQILSKKIPEYPKNNRSNAKVTLEFEVMPDGSVSNIIVLKKAFPQMETLSVDALKEWRFNPIGSDMTTKGVITFIYQVN